MITKRRANRDLGRMRHSIATAAKTTVKSAALAMAAGQVVARRSALGIVALSDPLRTDHYELSRIIPEKVTALNSGAIGIALQSGKIAPLFRAVTFSGIMRLSS